MIIRGLSGFGDGIYLYPIVRHYAKKTEVTVSSNFPSIYKRLGVKVIPFDRRIKVDLDCSYIAGKEDQTTTQWQDYIQGCEEGISYSADKTDFPDTDILKKHGIEGDYTVVRDYAMPMRSIFAKELLPNFIHYVSSLVGENVVLIGEKETTIKKVPCDYDLRDATSIDDIFTLVRYAKRVHTYSGFLIPVAEMLDKRCDVIMSQQGLNCKNTFISSITPKKLEEKSTTKCYIV